MVRVAPAVGPPPTPLALVVAFLSIVPYMGVILGSIPALLITAGLQSFGRGGVLLAIVVGLQLVHIWITQPEIVQRSVYVGPLVLVAAIVIGYRVYGMGGAVFGSAIRGVRRRGPSGRERRPRPRLSHRSERRAEGRERRCREVRAATEPQRG